MGEYEGDIVIYTNDSKSEVGTDSTFCAFHKSTMIHTWKVVLSGAKFVFQAELHAIKISIQWVSNSNFSSFSILSDSLSSLLAMQNVDTRDQPGRRNPAN